MTGNPAAPTAAALLKPFEALLDFSPIKAALSPRDESLLTILNDPASATANSMSLLYSLTRWDRKSLNDLLVHFGRSVADLGRFDLFRRIYDVFALIQTTGISASALIRATTNEPVGDTVRDLQAALRARYDASTWRDVVCPINDEMRKLQRDALVAYILHHARSTSTIDTADKLFEYFLADVQMQPCIQTSRIRHALSSVQLFIERCLMNLETDVPASTFNAEKVKQWQWRKRYRIWEANRKVFLFPENWLEPELRDDKSPFFKEIESELLQSDITEDSAATALLNYLSKLEEVAKLEPCGIYHQDGDNDLGTSDLDHVVARTAGANRKYYYRRSEGGSWTPWEQIKLDIEDNPVVPFVWNGRLFLFWLRILMQAPTDAQKPAEDKKKLRTIVKSLPIKQQEVRVQAVLCWSEYYNGKWQATKTSDLNSPANIGTFRPDSFHRSALEISIGLENDPNIGLQDDALRLRVSIYNVSGRWHSSFVLYNTHSLPVLQEDDEDQPPLPSRRRDFPNSNRTLVIDYGQDPSTRTRRVIGKAPNSNAVGPLHPVRNAWEAPFFFSDSRHVFFVTTEQQQVTIADSVGYGSIETPIYVPSEILPGLVFGPDLFLADGPIFGSDDFVGGNIGFTDPSPIQELFTEDVYIRRGLSSAGAVKYGDKKLGPSGPIHNVIKGKRVP